MRMLIRHVSRYDYAKPPARIDFLLRLWPSRFAGQDVQDWQVSLSGRPVLCGVETAIADMQAHVHLAQPDAQIEIIAEGAVDVADRAGVVAGLARDVPPAAFLRMTALTAPDGAIAALAAEVQGARPLDRLHDLMGQVRSAIAYRPGRTTSTTTAAEALALGAGVCQDHAHVFIAAARLMGIPARYVVGYYLAHDGEDAMHETHGWAEAYLEGLGWVGFDATNGVCPTSYHVRLCAGVDAADAAPIKGSAFGGAQSGITADVRIAEASADMQQMQQQQ